MKIKFSILLFFIGILISLFFSMPSFSETVQYTYDNLNRITKAEYSDGTVIKYSYDANGNRMNEEVKLGTHSINASAGSNGTISPSGVVTVDNGADQQFTITPDTGYHVADVKVDGSSVGPVTSYTFTNVAADHTIEVTFDADTYPDISVTSASHDYGGMDVGSSSPAQTFAVNNTGDAELLIGTISVTGTNANEFSIQNDNCSTQTLTPLGTCTVDIVFSPTSEGSKSANLSIPSNDPDTPQSNVQLTGVGMVETHTITASAGSNGSISPSGVVTVDNGADQQFTITPDTGYHVGDVKIDGSSVGPVLTYNFTNVAADHTIKATFEADTYPDIFVTPASHDFGSLDVGSSSPAQTFTVNNTGDAELLIGTIYLTGTNATEFSIQNDNCSNQTLTPSGTCTVDIIFSPTSEGAKSADLSLTSNDPDAPQSNVQLTGVGNAPPQSIQLNSGWNLISLKVQPADTAIATVLESINGKYISVWAYQDGSWKIYDPLHPGFTDLTTMSSGLGYWVNMKEPGSITFSGSDPPNSINLNTGWNLVGYNSGIGKPITDALASIAGKYVSVWAYISGGWKVYDPANPGLTDLTSMEPGYGYWINAMQACTWALP